MNPERINIKDLTIEEPEQKQEVFFDPEKDISEKDRNNFHRLLISKLKTTSKNLHEAAERIAQMNTLGIEIDLSKKDLFDPTKKDLENVYNELINEFEHDKVVEIRAGAAGPEFIFLINSVGRMIGKPDIKHPQPGLMHNYVNQFSEHAFVEQNGLYYFLNAAVAMKKAGYEPEISEATKKSIINLTESLREDFPSSKHSLDIARIFTEAKILGLPVKLSPGDWERLNWAAKSYLQPLEISTSKISPDEGTAKLLELYFNMAILAAEKIEFPEGGGIKLVKEAEDFSPDTPQVPETRNF